MGKTNCFFSTNPTSTRGMIWLTLKKSSVCVVVVVVVFDEEKVVVAVAAAFGVFLGAFAPERLVLNTPRRAG